MSEEQKTQRLILGRVVSDKMDKTRTILVERTVRHPLYGKFIRRSSKVHAHDETNASHEGDLVRVKECRPMSKSKRFTLVDIVESQTQG